VAPTPAELLLRFPSSRNQSVLRLRLDPRAPLYPRAESDGPRANEPLPPRVYELSGLNGRRWLIIEAEALREVTECEAVRALGAAQALLPLGPLPVAPSA
jgi:hypothetical protein